MKTLEQVLARKIIEAVSHGEPPGQGIEFFTFGLEQYLGALENEYLSTFVKAGGSSFKLVVAQYGQGKTHFLYCVRNMSWKHGFVTAYVPLSPDETPFHKLELVYKAIVNRLAEPPSSSDSHTHERGVGIDKLVRSWFNQEKLGQEKKGISEDEIRNNLEDYAGNIPSFENISFTRALREALLSLLFNEKTDFEDVILWLKGEGYNKKVHISYGISQRIDERAAFPLIRSLVEWIRFIGYSGLVILFDETETLPSLQSKQRERILENLRKLISESVEDTMLKNALILYSIPDEYFLEGGGPAYMALTQRLEEVFDFINPSGVKILLERTQNEPVEFLTNIGINLAKVFEIAYGHKFKEKLVQESARNIAEAAYEERHQGAHRRLYVTRFVRALHHMRQKPGFSFDHEQAKKLIAGTI